MKPVWVISLLAGVWLGTTAAVAEPQLVNGFAAIVNDKLITYEDVESAVNSADLDLASFRFGRQPQNFSRELDRLRGEALTSLVERQMILHEFETAGYKLPDNVIEEHIKDRVRESFGDHARLIQTLKAQGMSIESFRRRIREDYIVSAMTFKNVSSGVLVSPYKIQSYYEVNSKQFEVEDQVKLRMIFLGIKPDRGIEATRKLAEEIVAKLEGGAAFKDLASQYSDGSQRKEGGDWHWVQRKVLREDLAEVAFSLKPGERSGIIEKPDGFYLMLVEEFQAAHIRSLPEARDEIEDTLKRKERARLREEWIKRLRTKSFLQLFPLK